MPRAPVVLTLAAVLLVAGCTSAAPSGSPSRGTPSRAGPSSCARAFAAVLSRAVGPVRGSSTSTSGLLTCVYHAGARPAGRCSAATITINTAPQARTDFNRWVDEAVQNARVGDDPTGQAPVFVPRVGAAADWVPAELTFETATARRWVSVFLTCPDGAPETLALAEALARVALRA